MLSMPRVGICHTFKWLLMNTQNSLTQFSFNTAAERQAKRVSGLSPKVTDRAQIRGQTTAGGTFKHAAPSEPR